MPVAAMGAFAGVVVVAVAVAVRLSSPPRGPRPDDEFDDDTRSSDRPLLL
jgi:hypothetical protein